MKYERIIIAAMVCVTAAACCWIVSRANRWQFSNEWIFDREGGVAYVPVDVGPVVEYRLCPRDKDVDE